MTKELIITFSCYGIGGAQRRAFVLADNFARKGYDVYVLAVLGSDSTITKDNYFNVDERVKLVLIPDYYKTHKNNKSVVKHEKKTKKKIAFLKKLQYIVKSNKKALKSINFHINGLRKSIELQSFMLAHRDATIINFGMGIYDRIFFSSKGLNNKIIYAETNALNKHKSDRFLDLFIKKIKKSDSFVFQTKEQRIEHNLENEPNAYVIHNPIKSDLPQPYEGTRNKTIVNFCRMSPQKNLLLLIKAFEQLHKEFPDYTLELYADTDDPKTIEYRNELTSYIAGQKLEKSVFLLPPSSDIHNIILDSAMFVSSSDYEGISNSMIEAMAIGLPCVCTDCGGGGAREMITDGENGLLVPVGDVMALKNAMARMISEEGLAEKCSKNAAKIRDTHSIEKISEKWLDVIKNINGE